MQAGNFIQCGNIIRVAAMLVLLMEWIYEVHRSDGMIQVYILSFITPGLDNERIYSTYINTQSKKIS